MLVTVSTVKGAPGGTTIAFLLAQALAASPQGPEPCVLLECDPAGGDLARCLDLLGIPGLASLALAARHGLTIDVLLSHSQAVPGSPGLGVVPGIAGPEQGRAVQWLLSDLAGLLADPAIRAVVDLGRFHYDDCADQLRAVAAANLVVTSDDVASLLHARSAVESAGRSDLTIELVVAGQRSHRLDQVARATRAPVVGTVRHDPVALAHLMRLRRRPLTLRRRPTRPGRSGGLRSDIASLARALEGRGAPVSPMRGSHYAKEPR
jgi:hypothetical protein